MSNSSRMSARSTRAARLASAFVAAALASAGALWADGERRPGLLLGGSADPLETPSSIDPLLPTGPMVLGQPRPQNPGSVICGLRQPVCVHHDARLPPDFAEAYLAALESARALLVGALSLPPPLADLGLGPTPGLDLYLLWDAASWLEVVPDPRPPFGDRSSAHCRARPSAEELRQQALRCVGEALLLGLDAAEAPHLRRAIASHLARALALPSPADLESLDDLQANPQLGLADRELTPESGAAGLFFHYLDQRLGTGRPGALPAALVQLSRSRTALGRPQWNNEPDAVDVLRHAFEVSEQSFDGFLLSFAVARGFLGSRDNGRRHPELAWLRDAGRVRFDWVLKSSSLPRRVAPRRPLEPWGSAYLWLELDRVTLGKTLAFRAEWEAPGGFRWTLVGVDADGNLLQRHDLPYVQNATSAERTLVDPGEAVGLLIVGINLGGVDLAHPFDPDHAPAEPHGFTVYLTEI